MPRARDMTKRPDAQSARERDRARAKTDTQLDDAAGDRTVYSPPLSPEEIADIKAIASGADKLRPVSMSEPDRIFTRAEPDPPAARRIR